MHPAIVPIVYTAEFVALLQEEGVAVGDVLRGSGISRRSLRDRDGFVTHAQQLRIVAHYARIRGFMLGVELRDEAGVAILAAHDIMPLGPVHVLAVEELLAMFAPRRSEQASPMHPVEILLDYLESSDLSLEEIADLLGYEDAANFNRTFRKWMGEAPGRYRDGLQAGVAS